MALAKRNPLHIGTIFAFLFVLNYPLKFIATGFEFAVIDSGHYGEEWQVYALLLSNLSAILFFLPLLLFTRQVEHSYLSEPTRSMGSSWLWLLCYVLLVFYTYGLDSFTRLLSFYELRDLISLRGEGRMGNALAAISSQLGRICLIMFCFSLARSFKSIGAATKIFLVLFYCLIAYGLLGVSGSKNLTLQPLATLVIACGWVSCSEGRPWRLKRLFIIGVFGVSILFATGYLRSFPNEHTEYPEGRVVYALTQLAATFDAPDNLTVILYRMNDHIWGDMKYQPTLFNVLYSNIPRFIWSDKPLLHANQQIMSEYLYERYTDYTGEVLAPSMAGELIVSGGIVFMIPASFLLGLLAVFFYNKAHYAHTSYFYLIVYTWLVLNMFNLLRSGTSIIAPLWVFCGLTFLVVKFSGMFSRKNTQNSYSRISPMEEVKM